MGVVMHKLGGRKININEGTARIMRFAALLMPVILLFYGVLVGLGFADASHFAGQYVFFSLMIPWILLASYQFLYPAKTLGGTALWLAVYHGMSVLYILFVSGFATPFVVTWILLFIFSNAYFKGVGLWYSVLVLAFTAVTDELMHIGDASVMTNDILAVGAVLIVGTAVIGISRIQEIDEAELAKSKALESLQRDRILTIVNNLADAVLSVDAKGIVRVYNAAALNLLDTNTNLNGERLNEIVKVHDSEGNAIKLFEYLKRSRGVEVRDDLVMTQGEEAIRLEATYSPIRGSYKSKKRAGAEDGFILILRDVTKAKSLEEERDEFISVVSHELRTPITIAEGTISNVQIMMDRPDISDKILKEGINAAHEQIIFLARMVNDLSTLSRAERGVADTPETIGVRALVDDLFNEYAPQAKAKNLRFDLDLGTHLGSVTASSLYLRELLQNFITNSIKYTKEGGVTLAVHQKDSAITFEVRDTGIGISKSDQAKIFDKFYRSEDYRTRETGGTGLGLYVAMKLAKKLGTRIELKSRLNHGSSFSFTLPIKK